MNDNLKPPISLDLSKIQLPSAHDYRKPLTLDDLEKVIDDLKPAKTDTFYIDRMPLMPSSNDEEDKSLPIKITERFGVGVINSKGVAVAKPITTQNGWPTPDLSEQIGDHEIAPNVLLLPRHMNGVEFSDEQLQEFLEESRNDIFDIDKLLKWNPYLENHKGKAGMAKELWIDPEGLRGNLATMFISEQDRQSPASVRRQIFGLDEPAGEPGVIRGISSKQIHISDEMVQDGQFDIIGKMMQAAGKAMAGRIDQQILSTITTPGENKNGRVYTSQTLNQAMLSYDADK